MKKNVVIRRFFIFFIDEMIKKNYKCTEVNYMYEVKILNESKKIVYLRWEGVVKPSEVGKATEEMLTAYKKLGEKKFYILVDMTKFVVFAPETKELIVEQQKTVVPLVHVAADVFKSVLSEKHVDEAKEKANHQKAKNFKSVEEARKFLEEISIYK